MKKLKLIMMALLCSVSVIIFPVQVSALERVSYNLTYDGARHNYENFKITLVVNNREATNLPMPPVILDDYTYVPVKEIFTMLGAVVDWKDQTKEVYIGYGDRMIVLQIGNKMINNNGEIIVIPVAPKIINDKTMIPVRFAAEAFGFTVDWKDETKTVYVSSREAVPIESLAPGATPGPTSPPDIGYTDNSSSVIDVTVPVPISIESAIDASSSVIVPMDYPETQITSIDTISNNTYTIRASSEISKVDKFLLPDNRFVVDIYNAEMRLDSKTVEIPNNPYIKTIRAGQNQVAPQKITRIVFDIQEPVSFSLSMNSDRRGLTFSFEKNYISGVSVSSDGYYDYVRIEGSSTPVVSVFPLSDPTRLVIDLPLSIMTYSGNGGSRGRFIDDMRMSQYNAETGRVVLELSSACEYTVTNEGNATIVRLGTPTYKNLGYDSATRTLTIPKGSTGIRASSIRHMDFYNDYRYMLYFPVDMTPVIGYGEFVIKDDYINSVEVFTDGGGSYIVFNERRVFAFIVTEDASNIYIKAVLPKEKYDKIVILDPGHGSFDPGSSANGLVEKDLTLDISNKLIELIEAEGNVKVYATRVQDIYPDLSSRAEFGNELGDMFVSIHVNSFTNPASNGTEVWYYEHENDDYIGITSEKLASIMQKNLVADLGTFDRKHKSERFVVLKESRIPAVLCEIEFVSNPEGAMKLGSEQFRIRAAQSIYRSIYEAFNIYKPKR